MFPLFPVYNGSFVITSGLMCDFLLFLRLAVTVINDTLKLADQKLVVNLSENEIILVWSVLRHTDGVYAL